MSKARCPIEENNIQKGKDKCPFESICSSNYKKICKGHNEIAKEIEVVI